MKMDGGGGGQAHIGLVLVVNWAESLSCMPPRVPRLQISDVNKSTHHCGIPWPSLVFALSSVYYSNYGI